MRRNIKVDVNIEGIREKFSQENILRGRRAVANQVMADTNKFVPADEFILRNTVTIGIDGGSVNYNTPYAKKQYTTIFKSYTTPGTGPYWDKKAAGIYMSDWEKAFLNGARL